MLVRKRVVMVAVVMMIMLLQIMGVMGVMTVTTAHISQEMASARKPSECSVHTVSILTPSPCTRQYYYLLLQRKLRHSEGRPLT